MRLFLRLIFLFLIASGLAIAMRWNVGNVVLFYPPYRVDMSLNFFMVALFVLFFVLYGATRLVVTVQTIPGRIAAYKLARRERKSNQALRDALKAFLEGRFSRVMRVCKRAIALPENANLALLLGAIAAHKMRLSKQSITWLSLVKEDAKFNTARLTTTLALAVEDHASLDALAALEALDKHGIEYVHTQGLALKANQQANNWPEVLRLVHSLDKHQALRADVSLHLRGVALLNILSSHQGDAKSFESVWKRIAAQDKIIASVAIQGAIIFNRYGMYDQSCGVISDALEKTWDAKLLMAYAELAAPQGTDTLLNQIKNAERWAQLHTADAQMMLTLGQLYLKQKIWGQAQQYLEQALLCSTNVDCERLVHFNLARMYESLGQNDNAFKHYRLCALAREVTGQISEV